MTCPRRGHEGDTGMRGQSPNRRQFESAMHHLGNLGHAAVVISLAIAPVSAIVDAVIDEHRTFLALGTGYVDDNRSFSVYFCDVHVGFSQYVDADLLSLTWTARFRVLRDFRETTSFFPPFCDQSSVRVVRVCVLPSARVTAPKFSWKEFAVQWP